MSGTTVSAVNQAVYETPDVVASQWWAVRLGLAERPAADLQVRYRHTVFTRLMIWSVVPLGVVIGVGNSTGADLSLSVPGLVLLLVIGAASVLVTCSYVDLYPDRLVMDGPIRRRVEIPLVSIRRMSANKFGLAVHVPPGRIVSGPLLLGATTIRGIFGISDQSSRIEDTVMEAVDEARQESAAPTD